MFRMNYISETFVSMTRLLVRTVAVGTSPIKSECAMSKPKNSEHSSSLPSSPSTRSIVSCGGTSRSEWHCDEDGREEENPDNAAAPAAPRRLDLSLEFRNLTYIVQPNDLLRRTCNVRALKTRRGLDEEYHKQSIVNDDPDVKILDNISGVVKGGEIMAIMGPSGSGKTTLIDALAQRIALGSLQGTISLNGEKITNKTILRSISAYVMQDDLLFPMLTVKETLRFAAELRLPNSATEKSTRVEEVLTQLNLTKVANTIIGDEGHRGISGGERKRLSIGKEIIHDPVLLFLDEPTSGLDSTNALLVVDTLQRIVRTGSIVILSVHQPSERILKLVTTTLFIAEGRTVYRGPPTKLQEYFTTYLGYSIPEGTNTTEFALDLVQNSSLRSRTSGITSLVDSFMRYSDQSDFQTPVHEGAVNILEWAGFTRTDMESLTPIATGVRGALAASIAQGKLVGATKYLETQREDGIFPQRFANSRIHEVYVLAWRGLLNSKRTPELCFMRFISVMVSGFLLATIFWQLDNSPRGLKERLGFYAFATSTTFYTCVDTLPIFLQERHIFMRETAHDSYRISSYVLAIALITIPFLLFLAFAFSITTFWTVGLSGGATAYFFFLLVLWASFWAGNSFATLLSALTSNIITGYTVVVAALAYFLLLSGFFIIRSRIPFYWLWLHYFSLIKYPYEALLVNEFGRTHSECYQTGDQIFSGTPFQGSVEAAEFVLGNLRPLLQGTAYHDLNGSTCLLDGASMLQSLNVTELSKWGCLAVTVSFGIFFRGLFYVVLRYNGKIKRH